MTHPWKQYRTLIHFRKWFGTLLILLLCFLTLPSSAQFFKKESRKKKTKEKIEFRFRYPSNEEDINVVKFFVNGENGLTPELVETLEKEFNSVEGISHFRIRNLETGDCVCLMHKSVTAEDVKPIITRHGLYFVEKSIIVTKK